MIFALQLRRDHELLHAVLAQRVAELRVAELGGADPLLLFLYPATALQRQPHRPFQVFIRHRVVGRRVHQLEQAVDRLDRRVLVAAAERPAERQPPLQYRNPVVATAAGVQHSLMKSETRPKWFVLIASLIFGTSQPGR